METGSKDHLFKVLVVGDVSTGKTSIIQRYVNGLFSSSYRATLGVDFALKVVDWENNTTIRLQLWDIAGQERFTSMTRVYYKDAVAAFVVFDMTNNSTFQNVNNWKNDIDNKITLSDGRPIPVILLANKSDLVAEWSTTDEEMEKFCKENGIVTWFSTSAKDGTRISDAASKLIELILREGEQTKKTNRGSVVIIDPEPKRKCPC